MSVRMMTLVWELQLADSEKLVLLALADWANDDGLCWPSIETLAKKCSKSERTVQACIKSLCLKGHLTQQRGSRKTPDYIVHPIVRLADPRSGCTPQELHPAEDAPDPRKDCTPTPAAAAPNTSRKPKEPSGSRRAKKPVPDDWQPKPFGEGTQSRKIMDGWPDGELEAQLEQFKANHRAKGNTFLDPQDAWQTWVLNSRKFGIGRQPSGSAKWVSKSGFEYRGTDEQVLREAERRNDTDTYWRVKGAMGRAAA